MRVSILLFLLFFSTAIYAQQAEEIMEKFYAAMDNLENLSYRAERTDTTAFGETSKRSGHIAMQRNRLDPVLGYYVQGVQNKRVEDGKAAPENWEFIYTGGNVDYVIDHVSKQYWIDSGSQVNSRTMCGMPGASMMLMEFFDRQRRYEHIAMESTDSSYIVKMHYPDNADFDVTKSYKEIHFFKRNSLPFYLYRTLTGLGGKQVNETRINDIVVNDPHFTLPTEFLHKLGMYQQIDPYGKRSTSLPKIQAENKTLLNIPAPSFSLAGLDGTPQDLSEVGEKVILLAFWEIWCSPCLASIPKLIKFDKTFPKNKFAIWGITSDTSVLEKTKMFVQKKNLPYAVYQGNEETKVAFSVQAVPQYVIIDKNGIIRLIQAGFSPEIEKMLIKLIH